MKQQIKNRKNLETLVKEIENIPYDIRAEIIANELIEADELSPDEIMISNEGQFSRAFRSDVLGVVIQDDNFVRHDYLTLLLSRDSMYDVFPEGFGHSLTENNTDKFVRQMIKEHKHQKNQENQARKFFAPFENEIFNYRTKIEAVERDFLYKLNGNKPLDFFYDFWGLSKEYPPVLVSKFIQLLPYAYRIVGDIALSCQCLSTIIEEKVSYTTTTSREYSEESEQIQLGENRLGVDFICGNTYSDYSLNVTIEIGPIVNNSFESYIHEGDIRRFIDCFYEHFFPMEVEPKTILLLDSNTEEFNFNKLPVLGFTTRI